MNTFDEASQLESIMGQASIGAGNAAFMSQRGSQMMSNSLRDNQFSNDLFEQSNQNIANGSSLAITGLSIAGANAMVAAKYNSQLIANNLTLDLDNLSRTIRKTGAAQRAAAGASGTLVGGNQSHMLVMNESLSNYERQVVNMRNTAKQKQEMTLFEGQMKQQEYMMQAAQAQQQANAAMDKNNLLQGYYSNRSSAGSNYGASASSQLSSTALWGPSGSYGSSPLGG